MAPITTIVHFEVPAENVDRFFDFWQDRIKDVTGSQPGLIDGIFHRTIDAGSPFQFINVAHWESAEQLAAALDATVKELHQQGIEMLDVFKDLGVKASQNNYVQAVKYTGTAGE